jgi:spermidine synthase
MNRPLPAFLAFSLAVAPFATIRAADYVERHDTIYNSLTIERRGTVVELRARSRQGEYLESAVDLADPLNLQVAYTRSLYAGLFFKAPPEHVLMIGLGGAGFHRLFAHAYPQALLQSVELDPKVEELARTHMDFVPTDRTPVATMDGRLYVKRSRERWDWLILDAFRGGYVPPHLKTQEFYRECASRLADDGVFITNLHAGTELFYSDLKTLRSVFPQVVLFQTRGRGNVIAIGVKYASPKVTDPTSWPATESLQTPLGTRLDLAALRAEHLAWPAAQVERARLLTDDFSPVEFLDAMKVHNTEEK